MLSRISSLSFCGAALALLLCAGLLLIGSDSKSETRTLSQDEWPKSLQAFLRDSEQRGIQRKHIEVYSGSDPEFENAWQSEHAPELLDFMITRWRLAPVGRDHHLVPRLLKALPSTVSPASQNSDIDYYFSAEWLKGDKGEWYGVMHDKTRKRIVAFYLFNF